MNRKHYRNYQSASSEDMQVRCYYPGGYVRRRWIKFQRFTEDVNVEGSIPGFIEVYKIPTDDMPNPEYLMKLYDTKYQQVSYSLHIGMVKLQEFIAKTKRHVEKELEKREQWFQRFKDSDEPA